MGFELFFTGTQSFHSQDNYIKGTESGSFSGTGFGVGNVGPKNVILKGSMSGSGSAPYIVE